MTQDELDNLMTGDIDTVEEEKPKTGMVSQLSSVTVDSEKKATEIMNKLEEVVKELEATKECITEDKKEKSLLLVDDIKTIIFEIMSIMQYQDIHRQKIERVINTMVKISSMMSDSLSGVELPSNMAPSAKHIDYNDGESIGEDELAKMIADNNK